MKKNQYETPRMEVVKIQTRTFLADSGSYRSLPMGGDSDNDGIDSEDGLL